MAFSHQLSMTIKMVGTHGAIKLSRQFGGRDWTVPMPDSLHDLHPLVVMIGLANAQSLTKEFGGQKLKLPSEVNGLQQIRNHQVLLEFLSGKSISLIAQEMQIDRKMVQKILDSFEARGILNLEGSRQVDIFA